MRSTDQRELTPRRVYAICATGRSGSSLLCDLLRQPRAMGGPREFFSEHFMVPFASDNDLLDARHRVDVDLYVDRIVEKFSTRNGVFGTKLFFGQLIAVMRFARVRDLLHDCRYVLMMRRDVVAQAVSQYIATETGQWRLPSDAQGGSAAESGGRVEYDHDEITAHLQAIQREEAAWREFFAVSELDFLPVAYEELTADPNAVCHRVCRHLGVETDHEFSLENARLQRQGDELNRELRERFARDYGAQMGIATPRAPGHRVELDGVSLWEPRPVERR